MAKKSGLGRGVDTLFDVEDLDSSVFDSVLDDEKIEQTDNDKIAYDEIKMLKISDITPNRNQPRKDFDEASLKELADSIVEHGVISPIIVSPIETGGYQIIAGERRWRASQQAGLKEIPVILKNMDKEHSMLAALIENVQREDLSALEEAYGYKALIDEFDFTQEQVAKKVGKARATVTNALRLLKLPKLVQDYLKNGDISAGHAKVISSLSNESDMLLACDKIISRDLSVREAEDLVKSISTKKSVSEKSEAKIKIFSEACLSLEKELNRKVKISGNKKKGSLIIEFYGEDDLMQLIEKIER